jgi:hypothetical protein
MTPAEASGVLMCRAACANARMAAMHTENQARIMDGQSLKYQAPAFEQIIVDEQIGYNDVYTLLGQVDRS